MAENPDQVSALAQDIERYLQERPNASDTVEGIRRWWVGGRWADVSATLMLTALDRLVERHVVAKRALSDGSVVYFSPSRNDPGPPQAGSGAPT